MLSRGFLSLIFRYTVYMREWFFVVVENPLKRRDLLKRVLIRALHSIKAKHVQRYLAKCEYNRCYELVIMIEKLLFMTVKFASIPERVRRLD